MATAASTPLIAELEEVIKIGAPARQAQILKKVTDLFRADAGRLEEAQASVFDDVFVRLIERVDAQTLAQFSAILSEMEMAPKETVRQLAFHNDASVAAPVLTKSGRLSEKHLLEIANTLSQRHLLAISGRRTLNEKLTDALLRRGDINVSNALARNGGARFSECGYATLVGRAERDESLIERLGVRLDIPAKLLRELLDMATDAVRARFLTATRPAMAEKAQSPIAVSVVPPAPVDYTEAISEVITLNRAGKLSDSVVNRFAVRDRYANVVAALSFMSEVKIDVIESLMKSDRLYGLIVACKACRLSWSTTTMIIRSRPGCPPVTAQELEQGLEVFDALLLSVAQWTIRFGSASIAAEKHRAATAVA
ncbi:MAG: DUF2336 domain-containing protein [Bradyrhizobium sp.]